MQVINVVESLDGKWGPQVKDDKGNYYSFSKFYKGETKLVAGAYSMDIYVTAKGGNYINSLEVVQGSAVPSVPAKRGRPAKAKAEAATPALNSASLVKSRDFDAENRGKTRCALMEALLSNPNIVQSVAGLDKEVLFELVNEVVDYVFDTRKATK